jgi:CO dehydrogenase/acetyl-CoA synthase gamma subunit (corrinoid Fe-S protein)
MKVGASRLKQCPNQKNKMEALKYTIDFVKTCNLEMLYLVFGNEVSLRHLNFKFSNTLFIHFYDTIVFHSYEIYILMPSIEAP